MNSWKYFPLIAVLIISVLILTSCDSLFGGEEDVDALVQTSVAQTQAAQVEEATVAPIATEVPTATATITMTPPPTATSTITLTATLSAPQVQVGVNTNCRTGPGEPYDIRGSLVVGQTAEVVGSWPCGNYWIIPNPNGSGECWLWGYYATVTGPTDGLPAYTQPPTPTPVVNWTGSWTTLIGDPGGPYETILVNVTQSDSTASGSFTYSGMAYTMNGSLSSDKMTWSGTWDNGSSTGPFLWHWLNPNQFNGNEDSGSSAWCGYREGAGQPSPCLYP